MSFLVPGLYDTDIHISLGGCLQVKNYYGYMIAWSYTFVKLIFRVYNIGLFNIYQMDKSICHTVKFCFYKTVYPLDFRQALTSLISSVWNTMIGLPESRLKERYR